MTKQMHERSRAPRAGTRRAPTRFGTKLRQAGKKLDELARALEAWRTAGRARNAGVGELIVDGWNTLRIRRASIRRILTSRLFDEAYYAAKAGRRFRSRAEAAAHYFDVGARRGIDPHPLFDSAFYAKRFPEIVDSGRNPLVHYLDRGLREPCSPTPDFDSEHYLERYPELRNGLLDPLSHYLASGAEEGRSASADFDTAYYLERHPDVAASGMNPLVHYVLHGRSERRRTGSVETWTTRWRPPNRAPCAIVIPTRNSARWIDAMLDRYEELGVDPLVILDATSTDDTEKILAKRGTRYERVAPEAPRVEAIIPEIRKLVSDRWVLRFDDDEFPSIGLLKWLERELAQVAEEVDTIAIHRRWAVHASHGPLCHATSALWRDPTGVVALDRQWRLFRPDRADYTTAIHTPGYGFGRWISAPPEAYMVHFDWIIRSYEERKAKMRAYDAQSPGAGANFAEYYLLNEEFGAEHRRIEDFESREFDGLARRLAEARGRSARG